MSATKKLFEEIRQIEQQAIEGEINSLDAYLELNYVSKQIESSMAVIRESAIIEFKKYGEKTVEKNGCDISETGGGRYDYKDIPQWNESKEKLTEIEKNAQLAYKAGSVVNGIQPAVYQYNKPSLSIRIKNK